MIASLLALILVSSCLAADPVPVKYSGFRVTLKKDLLQSYFILDLKGASGLVPNEHFRNLNFTAGSGVFSAGFFMKDLKCTAKFDESKGSVKKFAVLNKRIEMDIAGAISAFEFAFNYEFHIFNIPFFAGTAKVHYVSSLISLAQNYSYSDAPTDFKNAWTITVDSITGLDLFSGITKSITHLAPEIGKTLDSAFSKAFQTIVVNNLNHWMVIKTPFYENNLLDVTLNSMLYDLHEYPVGYVGLGFFTKISVDDRPYNKFVWKVHQTDIPMGDAKEQVCIGTSLVTGIAEIRGKARDFLFAIEPKDLGLTGKLSDLLSIMPKLDEIFPDDEAMTVGCRPNGENDIVMINDGKNTNQTARIQIPINCVFGGMPSGKLALSVNFVMRADATKVFEENGKLIGVNAYAKNVLLYSFKTDYAIAPVADSELIFNMLKKIGSKLENFKILPKSLSIPITIDPASHTKEFYDHEYCINYS